MVRRELEAIQKGLPVGQARKIRPELFHLTLAYMGVSTFAQKACYENAADEVSGERFELDIDHLGRFAKAQVAYAKPEFEPTALMTLQLELEKALSSCEFTPDERPFRPHITLLRKFKGQLDSKMEYAVNWPVSNFALVESVSTPRGVDYRPLRFWPLSP